jgi:ubiquinone/menaquinone biosynthesis C-methylase UbiE
MGIDLEKPLRMSLSIEDWDKRFTLQAFWSRILRETCFKEFPLSPFSKILEVGSGTGSLLSTLPHVPGLSVQGIDIDYQRLTYSKQNHENVRHTLARGECLPFPSGIFDHCYCHYLLLWLIDPISVVLEMKRVTRKEGMIFIFSEPDYGGRIDFPEELTPLKELQIASLRRQGANPFIGRQTPQILHKAGLKSIYTGMISWSGQEEYDQVAVESEWEILQSDLADILSTEDLLHFKEVEFQAIKDGSRVQYVPIFYGWGTV